MKEFISSQALRDFFTQLTVAQQPDIVLEIGAREALYSIDIARSLPECRVVAFEAFPDNYNRFAAEVTKAAPSVTYLNLAVGLNDGPIDFYVNEFIDGQAEGPNSGRNSTVPRTGRASFKTITVEAVSAASFLSGSPGRIAVWMDVEGATRDVLLGFGEQLSRVDLIHCEVETHQYWKSQWLRDDVERHLANYGLFPIARDFEYDRQFNVVYARQK